MDGPETRGRQQYRGNISHNKKSLFYKQSIRKVEEAKRMLSDDIEIECKNSVLNLLNRKESLKHWSCFSLGKLHHFTTEAQYLSHESYVYFKTQNDYQRLYLVLEGQDLTCYLDETKKKIKFMHSLVSCNIKCDQTVVVQIQGIDYRQI
jgi:hypothetical protein